MAGGIYVGWAYSLSQAFSLIVSNCVIRNNYTNGLYTSSYATNTLTPSSVVVTHCLVENNMGSGVFLTGGVFSNTIKNCTFRGNVTYAIGAGLYLARPGNVINCLFCNNSRLAPTGEGNNYGGGGAMYLSSCPTGYVVNCTIVSNFTASGGGAIYQHSSAQNVFLNTILYGNRDIIYTVGDRQLYGTYWFTNCLSPALTGSGNLTAPPPAYENAGGGDFRLKPYSSGVDAGLSNSWIASATDLAGQPRISANGLVDMGAYETSYEPHPGHYVAQNGQTPLSPYTNWVMAASNIQEAVNIGDTNYPVVVTVGSGRYTLPANAVNYGGSNVVYINRNMILRSASGNPADTIIDGEGTNRGIAIAYNTGGQEIVIDGFTISNCHAVTMGGGVLLIDPVSGYSTLSWTGRVQNCRILDNTVSYGPVLGYQTVGAFGGGLGMHCRSASVLILSNCVVRSNLVTNEVADPAGDGGIGGGLYYGGYYGLAWAMNSLIQSNRAYRGGNAFLTGVTGRFDYCDISSGWAGIGGQSFGGGVFLQGNGSFRNCLLSDNYAGNGRGAAINEEGQSSNYVVEVVNSTLANNTGSYAIYIRGWAVANNGAPSLHLVNSIVYSNGANLGITAGEIPLNYSSYASNCCLASTNDSGLVVSGTNMLYYAGRSSGNFTNNPRFVNFGARDYRVAFNSPCINAGMPQDWTVGALDLDGKPRISPIKNGVVDIGAYEYPIQIGSVFNLR